MKSFSLYFLFFALIAVLMITTGSAAPAKKHATGHKIKLTRKVNKGHAVVDAAGNDVVLKSNALGFQYTGDVSIYDSSNNAFTASVVYDSGSADLWVKGTEDSNCQVTSSWFGFKKVSCSGYGSSEGDFSIQYGSGSTKGNVYRSKVQVADASAEVNFGVAYQSAGMTGIDGIFGTAFSSISTIVSSVGGNAAIDNILTAEGDQTISFYLDRTAQCSEMVVGGSDPALYDSDNVVDIALTQEAWWTFSVSELSFGSFSYGSSFEAISDTGTSLLYLPSDAYNSIKDKLIITGTYKGLPVVNCPAQASDLPTLDFKLGTTSGGKAKFSLTAEHYLLNKDVIAETGTPSSDCLFLLTETSESPYILGDVFIHAYYQMYTKDSSAANGGYISMAPVKPSSCS